MEEFNIGSTICRLRKEKGYTQEQLASMIGVSAGAVSKWETGNSKPDIDLLAPLARAFNTSLNDLLSFKEELSESDIVKLKAKLTTIFLHQGFNEGEKKCKEYLNEYPNSCNLKLIVGGLIHMYSMLLGEDFNDLIKEKYQYALSILSEAANSKDAKYSQTALFLISDIQMKLGNYEEAEKCLKELTNAYVDPGVLYVSLYENQNKFEEAEKHCEGYLLKYLNSSIAMLSILSRLCISKGDFDTAVFYLDTVYKIEKNFNIGLHSAAYNLCMLYLKKGEKETAAEWFDTYADGLISTEYDYKNNPYFNKIKLEVNLEGQRIMRKKLYQSIIDEPALKAMAGIDKYEKAIKKLINVRKR